MCTLEPEISAREPNRVTVLRHTFEGQNGSGMLPMRVSIFVYIPAK
jgi:hypothetical protein